LTISVADVQTYRDVLTAIGAAPKTINHRVSALSSFYKYLALSAAELRLPILVVGLYLTRERKKLGASTLRCGRSRIREHSIPGSVGSSSPE
jgi:site-specific recombinase XerD